MHFALRQNFVINFIGLSLASLVICAPTGTQTEYPMSCVVDENDKIQINFTVPTHNGWDHEIATLYIKTETEKVWKRQKTYLLTGKSTVSDSLALNLTAATLYKSRVVIEPSPHPASHIAECEFCSNSVVLQPVKDLSVHSVGPNWFALVWTDPKSSCPKRFTYEISFRDEEDPIDKMEWNLDNVLTLNTSQKYAMIMNDIRPNRTYRVFVVLEEQQGRKIRSEFSYTVVKTLPGPKPPTGLPKLINATNSSLALTLYDITSCTYNCTATWQFKEAGEERWRLAVTQRARFNATIAGLNASTVYHVRALLQRPSDCQPYEGPGVAFIEVATLPMGEPKVEDYPPTVINATNTSLTLEADCGDECKGYIAHWEYKASNETEWTYAGESSVHKPMTIRGLNSSTYYEVRYDLQWPNGPRVVNITGESEHTRTCSDDPPTSPHVWINERRADFIRIVWMNYGECLVNRYLVRWKSYDSEYDSETIFGDSLDKNSCPVNATLVHKRTMEECDHYDLCFTIQNLTSGTRYDFEVTPVSWSGVCGDHVVIRAATRYRLWGGISIGVCVLIIVGVLILAAAIIIYFFMKKKPLARNSVGCEVSFSSATHNRSGPFDDATIDANVIVYPGPTTRIIEQPDRGLLA